MLQHIKLPVRNGLSWGDFSLSDTLQEGNYRIRAYTNYMRNAGGEYFFEQHIAVVNRISNKIFTQTAYSYATQNGRQQINALITYTDDHNTPIPNKAVSYFITLNSRIAAKGKGITDDEGRLNISFNNTLTVPLTNGKITTQMVMANKELVTKIIPVKAISANVDVQFMPEGGNMVIGIPSKIAFKAVGADGLGADIKGSITDDKNDTVTSFSSRHLGMGTFVMVPLPGVTYQAHIIYADGSEKTINLPKAADKGYVLSINTADTSMIRIKVWISGKRF